MKFDFKGITFNIWRYMFVFALLICVLIGALQVVFIRPYYRNSKIATIDNVVSEIKNYIIDDYYKKENFDETFKLIVNNNMCAVLYNQQGNIIYSADSLGAGCLFNEEMTIDNQLIDPTQNGSLLIDKLNTNHELSLTMDNELTNQEMIVFGKQIKGNLSNYYLFINTPLEPVDSIVSFIIEQYFYLIIVVLILALILSLYIASLLAKPIVKMSNSAKRLASGKYDTYFEGNSFSEINELASTLNDATDELSKISELRKDMIANISHDIKTPLTMIKAYAEMIKDISGDIKEKRDEHLDVIIHESEYLAKLANDMQTLTKIESGVAVINRSNFNFTHAIENIVSSFNILLVKNEINLELNLDEDVIVYGDEIKLSQVVYNFVSNAIKHTPLNGTIAITLVADEDYLHFEVKDNGVGINPKDLPYIWDRYYKIDKQFQRKAEGTGLGLAISKGILEAHNAKYGVISKPKKGTTFYFELKRVYTDEAI